MRTHQYGVINVIALTACICSLTGCDVGERSGISEQSGIVVVTDSSGVRITETSAADAPTWSVSELPELRIGAVEGEEPYLFERVEAAFLLSDGRIVVADAGVRQLRYFSAEGEHIRTVGRRGQGPGEFATLTAVVRLRADSLLIQDVRNQRLITIGPDGTIVDEVSLAELPPMAGAELLGRVSEDEFVFRSPSLIPSPPPGYSRDTMDVTLGRLGGTALDTLLRLPSRELFRRLEDQGLQRDIRFPHPFGPGAVAAVWNSEIVAGTGESYEFGVYDFAGRLQALFRRSDAETVPLRGSDALEEYFPGPRFIPAYSEFLVDDLGLLWVGDFTQSVALPAYLPPRGWTVFERSGGVVGRVVTPQGFQLFHIAEELMIGLTTGEFDEEYVSVYRFRRTGPG